MKCDKCKLKPRCDESKGIRQICSRNGYNSYESQTNYDRIISKTPEELAKFLMRTGACFHDDCDYCNGKDCDECWLGWLKQEAET